MEVDDGAAVAVMNRVCNHINNLAHATFSPCWSTPHRHSCPGLSGGGTPVWGEKKPSMELKCAGSRPWGHIITQRLDWDPRCVPWWCEPELCGWWVRGEGGVGLLLSKCQWSPLLCLQLREFFFKTLSIVMVVGFSGEDVCWSSIDFL